DEIGCSAIARAERHLAAGAGDHARQRRPPGAGSDHGDVLEGHGCSVLCGNAGGRDGGNGGRKLGWFAHHCGSGSSAAAPAPGAWTRMPSGGVGALTSSSGQRARGSVASVSVSPAASRSAPAQAIIAPLSVHSEGGGTTSAVLAASATSCRAWRIA